MSDSYFIRFLNKATDLLFLNLLWLLTSLPIITIGASTTAMYYVSIRSIRYGDGYVWKYFWIAFKRDFKQATIVWAGMLVIILGLFSNIYILGKMEQGSFQIIMKILVGVFAVVYFLVGIYIFPVIAKFENPLKTQIKNAALFSVGHIQYTFIIVIMTVLFLYANYISFSANIVSLLIGVALFSYVLSFFYYKVFMNYMEERYDDFYKENI